MIIDREVVIGIGTIAAGMSAAWAYALQRERLRRAAGGWIAMFETRRALAWHEIKRVLALVIAAGGAILAIAFWWLEHDLVVDEAWAPPRASAAAAVLLGIGTWRLATRRRRAVVTR